MSLSRNRSLEKMSYNEIMGLIKPKTRLTESAHHIELPVETPPESPVQNELSLLSHLGEEEDSFDDSKLISKESQRVQPGTAPRQSTSRQSKMGLGKRASTAKTTSISQQD